MKIQDIRAKYLRKGYKVVSKTGKATKIVLIKKYPGKDVDLYDIMFETGAQVSLEANETLPVTFELEKKE